MTPDTLMALVTQYRAGLEAEMALLHQLRSLAVRQRDMAQTGTLEPLPDAIDQRDRVMANLVTIEHELKPIRATLVEHRTALEDMAEFGELATLHKEAATLVAGIVASDGDSLDALREAEQARQFAARAVEQGESTLAAYRRVVMPPLAGATLVNRKG